MEHGKAVCTREKNVCHDNRPTKEELEAMKQLLLKELDAKALPSERQTEGLYTILKHMKIKWALRECASFSVR